MMMNPILIVVCSIVFCVYLSTVSPSIAGGDSGEIVAEGCNLGTAHPPGYPLITLIIWGLSKVDVGTSVAYRINCFCTLCTTSAAFLIGKLVTGLTPFSSSGQILAVGMFSFSPLIWQYAVTAEVFPLNTLFAALLLYLVLQFALHRNPSYALVGALVCGLALSNQHTIVLYEAPLVLWMLVLLRNYIHRHPLFLLQLSGCFIAGLLPYLYLPLMAQRSPKAGSWGHVTTLEGLLHHILRRDYGTFQLFSGASGRNSEGFWRRCEAYLQDFQEEQGLHVSLALAAAGAAGSVVLAILLIRNSHSSANKTSALAASPIKKGKPTDNSSNKKKVRGAELSLSGGVTTASTVLPVGLSDSDLIREEECRLTPAVFLLTQLFYFGVFHSLANLPLGDKLLFGVHQRFWMQPNVLMFAWVGVGFDCVCHVMEVGVSTVTRSFTASKSSKRPTGGSVGGEDVSEGSRTASHIVRAAGYVVAAYLVYSQHQRWVAKLDYSDNVYFRNYATALLSPLPQGAVLLVNYDQQWTSVRYRQLCEGFRPDVTAIQLSMMTYKWFRHKREQYPQLTFPGTFHTYPGSPLIAAEGAFPLLAFLDSNAARHQIFIGGKLNYPDERLSVQYDMVPVGLVSLFVPFAASPNGTQYLQSTQQSWGTVLQSLPQLPDVAKYSEDTWEWTIGRDFKDRVMGERRCILLQHDCWLANSLFHSDTAAYSLQSAISTASTDVQPLADALYWLESSYVLEGAARCPSSLLKNLGLAHVHLIQNPLLSARLAGKKKVLLPAPSQDWFQTLAAISWPATNDPE